MRRLLIYPNKCINCKNCELACVYGHYHDFKTAKSRIHTISLDKDKKESATLETRNLEQNANPAALFAALGANQAQRGAGELLGDDHGINTPVLCLQCGDAACIKACPTQALVVNEKLGMVEYLPGKCIKCRACAAACPFGNITLNPDDGAVMKCDLCGGQPLCAVFCPTHAIMFG